MPLLKWIQRGAGILPVIRVTARARAIVGRLALVPWRIYW
eukprot:COSAG04_NODE_2425_length_4143_cov_810.029674_5_plen_40_part_00